MSPSNPYDRGRLEAWSESCLWRPRPPQGVGRDPDPLVVVAGEGCYLIDADGRRYLDGVGSRCGNVLGHRRPEVDSAVRDQLDRIAHTTSTGPANAPAIELAHRLVELTPEPLTRVFYSESGRAAVEVALGMALRAGQTTGESEPVRQTVVGLAPAGSTTADSGDRTQSLVLGGVRGLQDQGPLRCDLVWVAAPPSTESRRREPWPDGSGKRPRPWKQGSVPWGTNSSRSWSNPASWGRVTFSLIPTDFWIVWRR